MLSGDILTEARSQVLRDGIGLDAGQVPVPIKALSSTL